MFSTKRRREMAWAVIAALTMCLVLATVYTIMRTGAVLDAVREQQIESTERSKSIKSLTETITDCVNADGKCYQRNQERTAGAVLGIRADTMRTIVAALSCQAEGIAERHALARCTADRAARER